MKIKITTTFNISENNKPLIPVVSNTVGYKQWVEKTRQEALTLALQDNPDFIEDNLVVDISHETFIKYFLALDYSLRLKNLVAPCVDVYFGDVMQDTAKQVKDELDQAVTTEVEIIEDVL